MGGAADAGVVAADERLETRGRLGLGQVEDAAHVAAQVVLHEGLVLRRRRHDAGLRDETALVHLVAVEEDTARGLRRPGGHARPVAPMA